MGEWRISPWRLLLGAADVFFVIVLLVLASVAYFQGELPLEAWHRLQATAILAAALLVTSNHLLGLYNRAWEYASAETAAIVALSVVLSQLVAAVLGKFLFGALPILVWGTTLLGVLVLSGGTRFAWRMIRPRLQEADGLSPGSPKRALICGANSHGNLLMSQLRKEMNGRYQFLGFVDDDPAKQGAIVGHGRVLGTLDDLERLIEAYGVDEVIVAMPDAPREQIRRVFEGCRQAGIPVKVLPHPLEAMHDPRSRRVREVNVDDLLGRELSSEQITLSENYLAGKSVMVTGAGGSIGSQLARQICRYGPRQVLLVGRGENRIHWIYLHLRQHHPDIDIVPVVANVAEATSVESLLEVFRPEIVVHAAAHKHVYLMEYVPVEAARNNVLATARLAALAERHGVERFIFISTDKAACPANVMGATKRMCELLLTSRPFAGTDFICVRFGNVLGSEGSVSEIFKRQWQGSEPLTVTHPDATRYFMSIPEACFLVLQAGALGTHGNIFLLDMGEPMRILDLARTFVLLQGGIPDAPGAIEVTGLRPGEKLHERLRNPDEELLATSNQHISGVGSLGARASWEEVSAYLDGLERCVAEEDCAGVCRILLDATSAELSSEHWLNARHAAAQSGSEPVRDVAVLGPGAS
jgi:FlaA1/EpsC-like NDP-sugar epimerase